MKLLDTLSQVVTDVVKCPPEYAVLSLAASSTFSQQIQPDSPLVSSVGERLTRQHNDADSCSPTHHGCRKARAHNIRHLWVSALCVDHLSSAEISEAVTSSFSRIYSAAVCIVHLRDLVPAETPWSVSGVDAEVPPPDLEEALSRCCWFRGIWAVLELIASRRVEFFDQEWNLRLVKSAATPKGWLEMLSRVSGIDIAVLNSRDRLFDISLGRRLSWACGRSASRPEDVAYALAGICGVGGHLTPRYGEGGRAAFLRLQEKILKTTTDMSILAWKRASADENAERNDRVQIFSGILADSPDDFRHFLLHPAAASPFESQCEITSNNRGLCLRAPLVRDQRDPGNSNAVLVLNKSWRSREGSDLVCIALQEIEPGLFVRSSARNLVRFQLRKEKIAIRCICVCRVLDARITRQLYEEQGSARVPGWIDSVPEYMLDREDARPRKSETASPISTAANPPPFQLSSLTMAAGGRRPSKRRANEMVDPHSEDDCSSNGGSTVGSEDDILLFDSLPEKPVLLDADHPYRLVLQELVCLGINAWRDEKRSALYCASKVEHQATTSPKLGVTIGTVSIPIRRHKRTRTLESGAACGVDNEISTYVDETDCDEPDTVIIRAKSLSNDLVACPFYRLDPVRHHKCMRELELPNTRSAKQHVIVDHRLPHYCPVCNSVFESANERDAHIVSRTCTKPESPPEPLQGVSETQIEEISQLGTGRQHRIGKATGSDSKAKTKVKGSGKTAKTAEQSESPSSPEVDKWFELWDILFPHIPRPGLVYLSAPRERELVSMRRFWRRTGPELVANVLQGREMLRWNDLGEEAALVALHATVLEGMMESWFPFHADSKGGAFCVIGSRT